MSWFSRINRRPPSPAAPSPPPPPMTFSLLPAPEVHALPVTPADPLDIAVNDLWREFRAKHPNGTWDAFVASLQSRNRSLAKDVASARQSAGSYPPSHRYRA